MFALTARCAAGHSPRSSVVRHKVYNSLSFDLQFDRRLYLHNQYVEIRCP